MQLAIPQDLLAEMIEHARAELPNECCGLLAGTLKDGIARVEMRRPVHNDAASPWAYHTNPRDLLAAFRAIRGAGLELLAIYHSHPAGEPVPSSRDLAENTYGESVVHVIVGLGAGKPVSRGWWLAPTACREVELTYRE
jgi:proteasome lid subunit RPN8/RPN11